MSPPICNTMILIGQKATQYKLAQHSAHYHERMVMQKKWPHAYHIELLAKCSDFQLEKIIGLGISQLKTDEHINLAYARLQTAAIFVPSSYVPLPLKGHAYVD